LTGRPALRNAAADEDNAAATSQQQTARQSPRDHQRCSDVHLPVCDNAAHADSASVAMQQRRLRQGNGSGVIAAKAAGGDGRAIASKSWFSQRGSPPRRSTARAPAAHRASHMQPRVTLCFERANFAFVITMAVVIIVTNTAASHEGEQHLRSARAR
jgi:hypothetical protein